MLYSSIGLYSLSQIFLTFLLFKISKKSNISNIYIYIYIKVSSIRNPIHLAIQFFVRAPKAYTREHKMPRNSLSCKELD